MFEKAKWIAKEDISEIKAAPLMRKTFYISERPVKAELNICGLGLARSFINGREVGDEVLSTPFTKYDTRVIYNTYDVTDLLTEGKNALGVILGNGCYFVTYYRWDVYKPSWLHHPKLAAELVITYESGKTEKILSDSSWKTSDSAVIYNETKRGEIFDARLYDENWAKADFDDTDWDNVFICRSPGGVTEPRTIPPIRVKKRLKAKYIGNNVYDIGENISGWARIKISGGICGQKITIRYSERLHDDGTIAPEYLNTIIGSDTHCDEYIISGSEKEEWAPSFAYHGFRYAEVTGAPENFELIGEMIHTDFETIGEFSCSDDMLNKIHEAALQSILTNFVGLPTDCPQREQNGWTGDALLSAEQTLMNFDAVSSYKKWLRDIVDTQRPSGQICCIAPTAGWGYNWGSGPAWDSILIQLPYYIYYYTGDLSVVKEFWDNMKLYMQFMESMADNDFVCFGLGDWCPPEGAKPCPTELTDTAYFYVNNKIMARCEELLGSDGTYYKQRAESIKAAVREKYIDNDMFLNDNTTAIACAIYQDLYNDDEKPKAAKHLSELYEKNGFHINNGILGIKYLFTALSEYGYAETVYKLCVNPQCPSYAYWINNGMTTLCEKWDMSDSCNHHMFSEIETWLYKHIAGIHIDEGGKSVRIKPCLIPEIKSVRAKHGNIEVVIENGKITINSDVPGVIEIGEQKQEFSPAEAYSLKL
jgi:alpha-L-rhamnosidase